MYDTVPPRDRAVANPFAAAVALAVPYDPEPDRLRKARVEAVLTTLAAKPAGAANLLPQVLTDLWCDVAWLAALEAYQPAVLQAEWILETIPASLTGLPLPSEPVRRLHALLLILAVPKAASTDLDRLWTPLERHLADCVDGDSALDALHAMVDGLSGNDGDRACRAMRDYLAALSVPLPEAEPTNE